jgi:hypothetical protein
MVIAAIPVLLLPIVATVAHSEDVAELPDQFQAVASASGLSMISFKQPNPLPVGPGAFLMFETPEVEGGLASDGSRARTSLLYPGPAIAGLNALLCTAGFPPSCGQAPPPILAEAEYPQHKDVRLASDNLSLRDPSAPMSAGAASGEAHVTQNSSLSTASLAGAKVDAPDPARQAIIDALDATLSSIPGVQRAPDTSLFSFGGSTSSQRIYPLDGGKVRTEATSLISDVKLLAGAVTIRAIKVTSFAVSDGDTVREAGSTTESSGVLVGGFPATMGPEGVTIDGQSDKGETRKALNGVAGQLADAVNMAIDKLHMELRDGSATHAEDNSSAAADGLRISLRNSRLTETSPPQVSQLCTVTSQIQDPIGEGGLRLPPICAVPDLTGTADSYEFELGRAAVSLTAELYPSFSDDVGDLGGTDAFGNPVGSGGSGPTVVGGGSGSHGSRHRLVIPGIGPISFVAFEAHWLGDATDRFGALYLALFAGVVLLLLISKVVLRSASRTRRGSI